MQSDVCSCEIKLAVCAETTGAKCLELYSKQNKRELNTGLHCYDLVCIFQMCIWLLQGQPCLCAVGFNYSSLTYIELEGG